MEKELREHVCFKGQVIVSELLWNDVCSLLRDERWVDAGRERVGATNEGLDRLMRAERSRLAQAKAKMARVREGFEGGIYTLEAAKARIGELEKVMGRAEAELRRLEGLADPDRRGAAQVDALRDELQRLRDRNLDEATFEQRVDLIARLGVAVHPSEDLTTARVTCRMGGGSPREPAADRQHQSPPEAATKFAAGGAEVTFTPPINITNRSSCSSRSVLSFDSSRRSFGGAATSRTHGGGTAS